MKILKPLNAQETVLIELRDKQQVVCETNKLLALNVGWDLLGGIWRDTKTVGVSDKPYVVYCQQLYKLRSK
jgi:hypothetical protein